MIIDRSKLNAKAKEILTNAAYLQANCNELDKNEEYWKLYKDFHTETNFKYTKLGLEAFKVACLTEKRKKV